MPPKVMIKFVLIFTALNLVISISTISIQTKVISVMSRLISVVDDIESGHEKRLQALEEK